MGYVGVVIRLPEFRPGPPIVVSASSFSRFRQCPDQGLAHHRGIFAEPGRAAWVGQLVHRLIARDLEGREIDDPLQAAREEIGSTSLNYEMNLTVGRPSDIRRAIAEAVDVYQQFRLLPRPTLSEVEVSIAFDAGGGLTLRGRIDGVQQTERGVRIVDWKTGAIQPESEVQLLFYGLLWALDRRSLPGELEAISIQTGERASFVADMSRYEALLEEIAGLVRQVRSSLEHDRGLTRRAGPWCRYCPLLSGCEEGTGAVAVLTSF